MLLGSRCAPRLLRAVRISYHPRNTSSLTSLSAPAGPGRRLRARAPLASGWSSSHGGSLLRLERRSREWVELVRDAEQTVRVMPLWRLQTVGAEEVEFLYENARRGGTITLKPGAPYCFRAFNQMI